MVEFAHREALLMRTDALTASRRARKKRFLTGFAYQDDAPVAGEALAVSRRMRGRNLLRAAKLFGAAAVAIIAAVAFLYSGIDVSSLIPPGVFEFASHSNTALQSMPQLGFADFGSVQQEPWWTVPASVREFWRAAVVTAPPQAKMWMAGGAFFAASWAAAALGLSKSKKPSHDRSEDDHEI